MNTMNTKHTPGPLTVFAGTNIKDATGRTIARLPESSDLCGNPNDCFDETRANARLFAAAQDYHAAALKFCGMYAKGIVGTDLDACYHEFKAAIAKATGETKP